MIAMIDLDLELRRAWSGLLQAALPPAEAAQARAALLSHDPAQLEQAAANLLAAPGHTAEAVSGLHAAARLLHRELPALRHYGLLH